MLSDLRTERSQIEEAILVLRTSCDRPGQAPRSPADVDVAGSGRTGVSDKGTKETNDQFKNREADGSGLGECCILALHL